MCRCSTNLNCLVIVYASPAEVCFTKKPISFIYKKITINLFKLTYILFLFYKIWKFWKYWKYIMYKIVNEMICTLLPHYNSNSLCTMLKYVYVQCLNRLSLKHSSVSRWTLATLGQDCRRYRGMSGILGGGQNPTVSFRVPWVDILNGRLRLFCRDAPGALEKLEEEDPDAME